MTNYFFCIGKRASLVQISTNSLGIPDIELAQLSVKDLNKKLQHLPRDEIRKIKEKRRTLKNRG